MSKNSVKGQLGLDPTLPDVSLQIGSTLYRLAFDFNACAKVQAETGCNVFAQDAGEALDPIRFRAMFWASLLMDQPDITLLQAGKLITPKTMGAIAEAVSKAWADSQAELEPGNE